MTKLSFSVLSAVAFVALLNANPAMGTTGAGKSDPRAISSDSIVAKGEGFKIRRSQVDQVLATAMVKNPHDELPPEAEVRVVNQLIEIQLVLQKATDAEKAEGKQKTDVKLADIMKTMSKPEFEQQLKATLMTADDLQTMLWQEETAQISLTRQLGINVTDADAKKYFDDNSDAFVEREKAHVRELFLLTSVGYSSDPLPEATIEAKHKQIYELYKRFRAGENFTALARQYNEDPVSKTTGGEFSFTVDQMEKGMCDLAFSMKPGQVSEVITNQDGYVFFQLLEIIPAKKIEFSALSDKLKNTLIGRQKKALAPAYITQLRKAANVEILDPGMKAKIAAAEAGHPPTAVDAEQTARATNIAPTRPQ